MSESLAVPAALDTLRTRLAEPVAPELLAQVLRVLQRLGLSQAELQAWLERIRAVNDVTENSGLVESNAIVALDMVTGVGAELALRWDPPQMAAIYLRRCISDEDFSASWKHAVIPSDLLPPRPADDAPANVGKTLVTLATDTLSGDELLPQRADFFRVPKTAFTTRPAALLSLPDRMYLEAMASAFEPRLVEALPSFVQWPRSRDVAPPIGGVSQDALDWDSAYVVKADIASYYESIDHGILAMFASHYLGATALQSQALETLLDSVMGNRTGLPQGPQGSDLLASAYLLPVDVALGGLGRPVLRYADDYFIGAESPGDARRALNDLEEMLQSITLRLNAEKTRVMRRSTFEAALHAPGQRIERLRQRLGHKAAMDLFKTDDPDELADRLAELGVEDQTLWDLLYHGTTTVDEVVSSIQENLVPTVAEAYGIVLEQIAESLDESNLPENMGTVEREAREAVIFNATGANSVPRESLSTILRWFPRSAPEIASYLGSRSKSDSPFVRDFVLDVLENRQDHSDWVTAWLTSVLEAAPEVVDDSIEALLKNIIDDWIDYPLTRVSSSRALARAGLLPQDLWAELYRSSSPAIRSEMVFSFLAEPANYPWTAKQLPASE